MQECKNTNMEKSVANRDLQESYSDASGLEGDRDTFSNVQGLLLSPQMSLNSPQNPKLIGTFLLKIWNLNMSFMRPTFFFYQALSWIYNRTNQVNKNRCNLEELWRKDLILPWIFLVSKMGQIMLFLFQSSLA